MIFCKIEVSYSCMSKGVLVKKTVLVTGGAGYIGSHTTYQLAQQGYLVIVLDNFVHEQQVFMPWVTLINADFADQVTLSRIFTEYQVEAVMHFAAFIEVGESVKYPQKFYDNNVTKTLFLLDTMLKHNVTKFVFSSSCAVYGEPVYTPLDEKHPTNPLSPYGRNKLIVEFALHDYAKAYGLSSVSLRYFNACGATPELGLGEQHKPETHLIPLLLRAIKAGKPITIFGKDYDTIDGTCLRDYVHVSDIARAHVQALKNLEVITQPCHISINLGTGIGYTVQQVIKVAEEVCGKEAQIMHAGRRPGDCPVLVANAQLAKDILCWQPVYTDLHAIIRSAWQWELALGAPLNLQ